MVAVHLGSGPAGRTAGPEPQLTIVGRRGGAVQWVADSSDDINAAAGDVMRCEHVLVSAAAGVATVTMNRPERRNALSEAHMRD
jgi:hypothetical protein